MENYMSRLYLYSLLWLCYLSLNGCALGNVQLPDHYWQNQQGQKVTIVTVKASKPGYYASGNQGILDYAISASENHNFISYLEHTNLTWYQEIPQSITKQLAEQSVIVKAYKTQIPSTLTNSASLAKEIGNGKMLILQLKAIGALRYYYSFIPLGPAQAYCRLSGELIDVETNATIWRYEAKIIEPVKGEWDQAPGYPNFTQALDIAIAKAKTQLVNSFFSKR
jgi:hypothetical protein